MRYIIWIVMAKPPETRQARMNVSLVMLARGKKLGLK